MAEEIHLYDSGTVFLLNLLDEGAIVNLSTATTLEITFKPPRGVAKVRTGLLYTDGSDGILQYTTDATDLDETGSWKIQAKVVLPSGTWSSNIETFSVVGNLS